MWFFYNFAFTIAYLLMLPYFFRRMWRRGGYRRGFLQRLAVYDASVRARLANLPDRPVWVHAVSVGEVRVALGFMAALRQLRPESVFVLTTTTSTGHALARAHMDERDVLLYYPVDFPCVVKRAVRFLMPRILVLVDGEFWPNMLRRLAMEGVPVALVNGRVSERSFRGYRRLRWWTKPVLASLSFCGMQSAVDAERIRALGALPECVRVLGSAKYDVALAARQAFNGENVRKILEQAGVGRAGRFLVGGSTWPGEEKVLLRIFQVLSEKDKNVRLILAPRHVERKDEIVAEIKAAGCTVACWSAVKQGQNVESQAVLLVDTTGDLPAFYAIADVIFIGKSLCAHGGQNPLEAAVFGKAIAVGPSMENFLGIMDDLEKENAVCRVYNEAELECAIVKMFQSDEIRQQYGMRARAIVEKKSGVLAASADEIKKLMDCCSSQKL